MLDYRNFLIDTQLVSHAHHSTARTISLEGTIQHRYLNFLALILTYHSIPVPKKSDSACRDPYREHTKTLTMKKNITRATNTEVYEPITARVQKMVGLSIPGKRRYRKATFLGERKDING
jgi:hypothetical protein